MEFLTLSFELASDKQSCPLVYDPPFRNVRVRGGGALLRPRICESVP